MPSYPSHCTACGAHLSGENRFCTRCGAALAPSVAPPVESAEPTAVIEQQPMITATPVQSTSPLVQADAVSAVQGRRRRVVVGVAAALALVLVGAGIGLFIERQGSSGENDTTASPRDVGDNGSGADPGANTGFESDDTDSEPDFDPADPLALDYPFENRDCFDDFVVVLASSAEPSAYVSTLAPALSTYDSSDLPAKYLRTDDSCAAFNAAGPDGSPIYAAYLGPFDDGAAACSARMERTTTSTYVKQLSSGADGAYYCLCSFGPSDLPDLNNVTDAESSGDRRFWMVELQHLMFNAGYNPDELFGGNFGSRTTEMVRSYQSDRGLPSTGSLDSDTWSSLQAETCSE